MLTRGETTEDRIAKIADGFNKGAQNFISGQNSQQAKALQAEASRRQQAIQAFEIEAKMAEQTGRFAPQGTGANILGGMPVDLGAALKGGQITPKYEKEQAALTRQLQIDEMDKQYKQSQIDKNNKYDPAAVARAKGDAKNGGLSLTKGDESADREYGKNYNNFISKGIVNSESSIKRLEEIAGELEKDQGFGEASGTKIPLPDWARSSDAIRRREGAKNAAFSTIKELLPGSVSDSDREAVTRDYYNDQLGAKENAKIIREKIAQLKDIRELEIQKAHHFGTNGTLKGFNGSLSRNQVSQSANTQQAGSSKSPWLKYGKGK